MRIHERDEAPDAHPDTCSIMETCPASPAKGWTELRTANKTQAAEYHPGFIDVPGEYLEVRSFYRALIMLTCEACGIALIQAADDEENLYPSGLARTFDKPVAGIVTKTDVMHSDTARAETILREAGATEVFFTSALNNTGIDELIRHLDKLRE